MEKFVPAADEVWALQHEKGPECDHFRLFCEKGHYGGRTQPTDTRQGTYACTPSGEFLASINTNDPRQMAAMMKKALEVWEAMPKGQRLMAEDPVPAPKGRDRMEMHVPTDGLVLR